MTQSTDRRRGFGLVRRAHAGRLLLLWCAGVNLRVTMLAVPPLLPLIRRDLGLDPVLVGALNGLPVLLIAVAAISGSLLIAWIGARRALVAGLLVVGLSSALRGVGPSIGILFAMTLVMSLGVAMLQPTMPAVTRAWCPAAVGRATAIYANGLLVGELLGAALTIPVVLPLVGQSWPWALAAWSLPALLTAVAVLVFTGEGGHTVSESGPGRWWPDWRDPRTWRIGLILGSSGAVYFTTNAFIPDLLQDRGEADLIAMALTSLNAGQLPASLLMTLFSSWLMLRRGPLVAVAVAGAGALAGLLATTGALAVACAGVIGFAAAFILIWAFALPPMVAPPEEVPRLSAGIFTVGYLWAFLSPLLGGVAWQLSGLSGAGLVPAGVALTVLVVAAARLRLPKRHRPET